MLDFTQMKPNDFEEYVAKQFQKLGFRTQLTQKTGDGGIDIIAQFDGVIFQGKYLIQCKLWNKNVGEQPIRDLYGVIQSEKALKGIVVTSSDFSSKAREFAKGKNIELINGDTLRKLVNDKLWTSGSGESTFSYETRGFLEHKDFPENLYSIITKQIERNPKLKDTYKKLFELLLNQILQVKYEARNNGLLDECIYYSKRYKDEFTKKNDNESKGDRIAINYILIILNFIKGNLVNVYELLVEIREGYHFKTNWRVKHWWGLPRTYEKYCSLLFYSLCVIIRPEIEESNKIPVIYYPFNFYYEKKGSFLSTVSLENKVLTLEEFLGDFKITEIEGFKEQTNILNEIMNETLYDYEIYFDE